MAGHTLKLMIYTIALRDGERKDSNFKKLHQAICENTENEKPKLFGVCKDKFLKSFKDKFVLDNDNTKGIAIKSINCIPEMNIIDGMMIGGLTGIEQEVYKTSSSRNKENTITEDEITALPYYFKIWMPYNSNLGVIMVQSYTETGVVSLVVNKFREFFRSYGFSISTDRFVHEKYKKDFKKYSFVDKLVLTKSHLSREARGALNQMFTEFEGLKVEIKVSGFNISIDDFWNNVDVRNPLSADLSEFEMNENEYYDVVATYKDVEGKQSQARLSKNLDILPTITLSDELKETGKEYPDYHKIQIHTNTILQEVKKEIGYEAQNVG